MCLIIDRPTRTAIDTGLLATAINDNPHGWGIMRAANGKLQIQRGLDPADFWPAYRRVGKAPCAIHFRYMTHGARDIDNCHPFTLYGGQYALMHNGIINVPTIDKSRSDTWHFGHYVLEPMLAARPELFGTDDLSRVLGSIIGAGNKLVILRSDGESMIVNRSAGLNHDGLWLSNSYFLPDRQAITKWPDGSKSDWQWSRRGSYSALAIDDDDYFGVGSTGDDSESEDSPDSVSSAERPWTLWDFEGCDRADILDYLIQDPDSMADMIVDALR